MTMPSIAAEKASVFGLLQEHSVSIARIDGELGALSRGVDDVREAQTANSLKLDKVLEAISAISHRPRVPGVREILFSLAAFGTLLGVVGTGATIWFSYEFDRHAKDFSSRQALQEQAEMYERKLVLHAIDSTNRRLDRIDSYLQVKPAFRDWAIER